MSYYHPSGHTNSGGTNPDKMSPDRIRRADEWLDQHADPRYGFDPLATFFQWHQIREDILHFTPFDSLPQEQQDRARRRRWRGYQNSNIPWVATDATALLTTIDDVDDMGKLATFAKDYFLKPAKRIIWDPSEGLTEAAETELDQYKQQCALSAHPRERKIALRNTSLNDLAILGGLQALKWLFPAWRFLALGLQAAQAIDSIFGVGIQLGPVLGLAAELFFRGLDQLGLPFGPEHNKYHQIKAARVTSRLDRQLAAHAAQHPEDTLSTIVAGYTASTRPLLPTIIFKPEDYPNLADTIMHPSHAPAFGVSFLELAASLPYNAAAYMFNDFLAPMLENWSESVNGQPVDAAQRPKHTPGNPMRAYMRLADQGICPGPGCDAELYQDLSVLADPNLRVDLSTGAFQDKFETVRRLGWHDARYFRVPWAKGQHAKKLTQDPAIPPR